MLWFVPGVAELHEVALLVEEAGRNSSNSSVQYAAPWSVLIADACGRRSNLREQRRGRGRDARARPGRALLPAVRIVIRLVALIPLFARSLNGPSKVGARLQLDGVAWLRGVDRGLQVASGVHPNRRCLARAWQQTQPE